MTHDEDMRLVVARVSRDLDTLRSHFKPVVDTDYDADPGVVTEAELSGILVAIITLFAAWRSAQGALPGYASVAAHDKVEGLLRDA